MRRGTFALLVLAAGLLVAVGAAGCSRDGDAASGVAGREPERGGTLRMQTEAFEWFANFDPTGEYQTAYFGIYRNLLGRTLMGYRHVAGAEGNELIPDLAAEEPEISEDGKTYTFTIREGVRFSPPVGREVTSRDILYAFERIGTEPVGAQYGFYYERVIDGLTEFKEAGGLTKDGNEISGIETPDARTVVFRLKEPAGDFPHMLAMPAAGPIPEEVARCFTKAGEYGRFVISSGPYMVEGSDELDVSSCKAMKRLSGFDPNEKLVLERNPNYDAETDTREARENFFDRWELTVNPNVREIFDRVRDGDLDLAYVNEPPDDVVRDYTTNDELADRYKRGAGDVTAYISMNLTQPPFDDVHVRKAMNWVTDKEGLRRAWGGELQGEIHHHVVPDTMFDGELSDYDPYPSEGDAGDLEKAKDEMRQSKYDTDQDGLCDAPQCRNVLHVARNTDAWAEMQPVVEESARKIGIELTTRQFEDSYAVVQSVERDVAMSSTPAWGKDYPDASTFMVLFDGREIRAEGNLNHSLVGLTPEQAQRLGVDFPRDGVPSVDQDIDRCSELQGDERKECWIDLDRRLMEEVVPWIPYLERFSAFVLGDTVSKWEYDQSSGGPAWAHIAVDPANR